MSDIARIHIHKSTGKQQTHTYTCVNIYVSVHAHKRLTHMQLLCQWLFTSVWGIGLPFKLITSQFPQHLTASKLSPCAGQGLSDFCALFLIHFPFKTHPYPRDPFFQSLWCPVNTSQSFIVTPWLPNPRLFTSVSLPLQPDAFSLSHSFSLTHLKAADISKRRQSSACTSYFLTCHDVSPKLSYLMLSTWPVSASLAWKLTHKRIQWFFWAWGVLYNLWFINSSSDVLFEIPTGDLSVPLHQFI